MIVEIASWEPDSSLEEASDPRPDRARRGPRSDAADEDVQRAQAFRRGACPRQSAVEEADEVLALAADVEHPAAERERDGQRREH